MAATMAVEIVRLGPAEIAGLRDQILHIYGSAFAGPPYERGDTDVERFGGTLARHLLRGGFRMVGALERSSGRLLGFNYGYTSQRGQWWHDLVAAGMAPPLRYRWLMDAFEYVELAVQPEAQGNGYGGRLHDALLDGLPHRTAVLSTMQAETNALHLYRKRGWETLIEAFVFPQTRAPYLIMGLDLDGRRLPAR